MCFRCLNCVSYPELQLKILISISRAISFVLVANSPLKGTFLTIATCLHSSEAFSKSSWSSILIFSSFRKSFRFHDFRRIFFFQISRERIFFYSIFCSNFWLCSDTLDFNIFALALTVKNLTLSEAFKKNLYFLQNHFSNK